MQWILRHRAATIARSCVMALLLVGSALSWSTASAQLPTPLPKPNVSLLTSGSVYAIAKLPGGSAVIGGQFVSVNGTLRSNIAKRLPDGTLDPDFHPTIDGTVLSLASDSAGNAYVGGVFNHADGYARRNLVKLTPAGTVVAGWDPSPDGEVWAIAINVTDEVFVGGNFQNIGGQQRSQLAKLSVSTGAVDSQWNPAPVEARIRALRISHDGQLYVGGYFSGIGQFPQRRNLAKVSMSGVGEVDPNWDPSPNNVVTDIAVAPNGSVYVAGSFFEFRIAPGQNWFQRNVAKLSGTGAGQIIGDWDPFNFEAVEVPRHVAVGDDGWVYVSGFLSPVFPDGTNSAVIRISEAGTGQIDASWNPKARDEPHVLSFDDGKLLVGGSFSDVAGQTRLGFVVLNSDASPDAAFDAEGPASASAVAVQPDGRLIVSGAFQKANGLPREGLLRLNADGRVDLGWNPSPNDLVSAIAFTSDGSIIVGGYFSKIGGQSIRGIAKLSSINGLANPDWNPGLAGSVRALAVDGSGMIYAGGMFEYPAGVGQQQNLVRIGETGTGIVDATWRPIPVGRVDSLSLDGSGALFVSGSFTHIADQPRPKLAKLFTGGPTLLDPAWIPTISSGANVPTVIADGLGSVYVIGGLFPTTGCDYSRSVSKLSTGGSGAADPLWNPAFVGLVSRIALDVPHSSLFAVTSTCDGATYIDSYLLEKRSTTTGTRDPTWNPMINDWATNLLVDGDRLLLGGYFTQVGGHQRYGLAALPLSVPDLIHADGFDTSP